MQVREHIFAHAVSSAYWADDLVEQGGDAGVSGVDALVYEYLDDVLSGGVLHWFHSRARVDYASVDHTCQLSE